MHLLVAAVADGDEVVEVLGVDALVGDVVGGALGGKDPQLQMIGLQQQILSELDPSDPEQQLSRLP